MANPSHSKNGNTRRTGDDFRISNGPLAEAGPEENRPFDLPDFAALPAFGGSFLCAIPRDPRTLFTYWQIDWPQLFADRQPADRQVHLRVHRGDSVESSSPAEPMAGNAYLTVARPGGRYRVEIGYYQPQEIWHSVAMSEDVTMPVEGISESEEVDLATIPLHLSFQRLIDLFRAQNGDALAEIIARLQRRAINDGERALLSAEDWEILRAMDMSIEEFASAQRNIFTVAQSNKLQQRAEAVLGFGATSPGGGFGESSWS